MLKVQQVTVPLQGQKLQFGGGIESQPELWAWLSIGALMYMIVDSTRIGNF